MLPDAGRIQEEDARQANKHGYSKHDPALPLFTESDALRALTQLQPLGYERPIEVVPGVSIEFHPAGHLLGSAFVIVRLTGGPTILFGGDLGRYNRPVLPDPSGAIAADVVLVESTYGDRITSQTIQASNSLRSSRRQQGNTASWSSLHSRSDESRSCCIGCDGWKPSTASRCSRYTSIVRWRRRP